MTTQIPKSDVQTLEITNFTGALTRHRNGQMNSGLAKFDTSFGYDPFSKPGQLTWLEQPVDITGSQITDLIVAAKGRYEGNSNNLFIYAIGSTGRLYKIQPNSSANPNLDTASIIGTITASSPSFNFGGSMEFYNGIPGSVLGKIFVGSDTQINTVNTDGSGDSLVGTVGNYYANRYRPVVQFLGYLVFGNANNVGLIDTTNTVISPVVNGKYQQLSPAFPPEVSITDLDVSPDGNYLYITTSGALNENILTVASDGQNTAATSGSILKWNGSDSGITASTTIPSYGLTALQTFLDQNKFFSNDSFGGSLSDGSQKELTLTNNKSPLANATLVNGNFISWINPESDPAHTSRFASMYYFGQMDSENAHGLWRVMKYNTTLTNGFIYQTPVNVMTNNKYSTVNSAETSVITTGFGKHYFSVMDVNNSGTKYTLQRFCITPTGSGTPQIGVWETQNQLFGKRVSIAAIRVYTEPTVIGNGFQVDVIGSDGIVATNGTFNYTYAAGTDITLLQGALERINFNPNMLNLYSFGIRITNTGTTNMTINKIEIDWSESGK